MIRFYKLPEFDKELKKLSKKYPSLEKDLEDIKPILSESPTGIGKNFTIIKFLNKIKIVKARIHCESLKARSIRLVYAFHEDKMEFIYIELYFKGNKENEDKGRIEDYLSIK